VISARCRLANGFSKLVKGLVLKEPPVNGGLNVRVLR